MVPLPPEQLIPVQVALAEGRDPAIANQAVTSLRGMEPRLVTSFLESQATERELSWFGRHSELPEVVEVVLRRQDTPRLLLADLAPRLWPELQDALLLRQDAIIEHPPILDALETNPQLTSNAKRRIWEYREHLLPRDKVAQKKPEEILAEADKWTDDEVKEAIDEARERNREGEKVDELGGLNEGQVRMLPLPARVQLARKAGMQLRRVLVRDANATVAKAVLSQGQKITDQELELIAKSRAVHVDVLAAVAKNREWIRKYSIVKALARNPRTNLSTALRLLPRLSFNDLRSVARDRNVPQAVRGQALRMGQTKR